MNGARRTLRTRAGHAAWAALVVAIALAGAGSSQAARAASPAAPAVYAKGKLPRPPAPAKGAPTSAEGIVQSVAAKAVVLRELDGSAVTVPVNAGTHVFVDGRLASLHDVRPGFVASAKWKAGKATHQLLAFDHTTVAVVDSVSVQAVVATDAAGTRITIHVTPKSRVFVDGRRSSLHAVKAGFTVVVEPAVATGTKPAAEVRFLRPAK